MKFSLEGNHPALHKFSLLIIAEGLVNLATLERLNTQLRLNGVCSGCPSTIMTVIMGIEQELRRLVPEVDYLEVLP